MARNDSRSRVPAQEASSREKQAEQKDAGTLALGFLTAVSAHAEDVSKTLVSGSFSGERVYAADSVTGTVENSSLTVDDENDDIAITNWANLYGGLNNAGVTETSTLTVSKLKYSPTSTFTNSTKVALYGESYFNTKDSTSTTGNSSVSVNASEIYANIYGGSQVRGSGTVVTAGTTNVSVSNTILSGYNPTNVSYYPGTIYGSAYVDQSGKYYGGAATTVAENVNGVNYDEAGTDVDDPGLELYGGGQLYGYNSTGAHLMLESTEVLLKGDNTFAYLVCGGSQISGAYSTNDTDNLISVGHTKVTIEGGTYEEFIAGGNRSNWYGDSVVGVSDGNGGWKSDSNSEFAKEVIVRKTSATTTATVIGGGEAFSQTTADGPAAKSVVYGDTNVEIAGGKISNVIGGGMNLGYKQHDGAMVVGNTNIVVSGREISGSVVGGGYNSAVDGNVNITISDGKILGDVYAGGIAVQDAFGSSATVSRNATVTITGGTIEGKIYGCKDSVAGTSKLTVSDAVINGYEGFDVVEISAGTTGKVEIRGEIQSATSVAAGTSVTVTNNGTVTLSSATESLTVNTARELAAAEISLPDDGDVAMSALAAWAFDIEKSETAKVTVTLDVGAGLSLETIKIYHKANGDDASWEDYTDRVGDRAYDSATGKLSFTATDFSSYAAGTASPIPEPSAFGLLAGAFALALAASRRRRK